MRALGVFVSAPIPGRVMPRLADEIGPSGAAEVYWRLGRQVLGASAGSGHRTTVWFTPASEEAFVREWLEGVARVAFRPQHGASLGDRLRSAFVHHFGNGARRVVIVGADCPGVGRRLLLAAFNALGRQDVVLGPAVGGGVYLIGLVSPHPALFQGMSGAAPAVCARLAARSRGLGLSCVTFPPLRDVATARDARALGLLNY